MAKEKNLEENETVEEVVSEETTDKTVEQEEVTVEETEEVEETEKVEEPAESAESIEEEPVAEEKPKKEKPEREGRSIISRVLNILLWIVLFAWMALVIVDYIHVKNDEEPQFCWFNDKTTDYADGSVHECTGLGYKVINYNRESFKAIEFGPFWIADRTAEDEK